jgi:hypothetical protein
MVLAPSRAAAGQDPATEAQIREGLLRRGRGEVAFHDAVRLVDLIDRAAQTVSSREAQARFALYRLQSMKNAAAAIEGGAKYPHTRAPMLDALFHSDTECGELNANLDPLVAAIRASRSQAKAPALAAADRFARLCRRR